jgi:hypothetical protein
MSSDEDHPGKHHTLIFDVVRTNAGNGYNKFSGLFAFFIISYDAYAPGPFIIMLPVRVYKPLTGAVNSPENLLYPLPAFVLTTSNIKVWCFPGWSSSELMYA